MSINNNTVNISIMGIIIPICFTFHDQALEWSLASEIENPEAGIRNEDKLLEVFLQVHCSGQIEAYLRNWRHWNDYEQSTYPESFYDSQPHF